MWRINWTVVESALVNGQWAVIGLQAVSPEAETETVQGENKNPEAFTYWAVPLGVFSDKKIEFCLPLAATADQNHDTKAANPFFPPADWYAQSAFRLLAEAPLGQQASRLGHQNARSGPPVWTPGLSSQTRDAHADVATLKMLFWTRGVWKQRADRLRQR